MKKLSLNSTKTDGVVELETVTATCSFCGENVKTCIRGSIDVEVTVPKYNRLLVHYGIEWSKAKLQHVFKAANSKYEMPFFGKSYYKFTTDSELVRILDEAAWENKKSEIYERDGESTYSDYADICYDCIRQLAVLTKGKK